MLNKAYFGVFRSALDFGMLISLNFFKDLLIYQDDFDLQHDQLFLALWSCYEQNTSWKLFPYIILFDMIIGDDH